MLIAALVLAAAPSPVELHAIRAGLLSDQASPIGSLDDGVLVERKWVTQTLLFARHDNPGITLDAYVDVSRDGTFVEAVAKADVTLSATKGWTVVLEKGAAVPVMGHFAEGLRIGFLERSNMVVPAATIPDIAKPVPEANLPEAKCWVRALHAAADVRSARWEPSTVGFTVHLGEAAASGWAPAYADGEVTRVHGFARAADVLCDAGVGGGLGLSGFGGASDGVLTARSATLPVGTQLFWSDSAPTPFATLRQPVTGLRSKTGWRILIIQGETRVVLNGVTVKADVTLGPEEQHGVGGAVIRRADWPRLTK